MEKKVTKSNRRDGINRYSEEVLSIFHEGLLYATCRKLISGEYWVGVLIFSNSTPEGERVHRDVVDFLLEREFKIEKITHSEFLNLLVTEHPESSLKNNYRGWWLVVDTFVEDFKDSIDWCLRKRKALSY